MKKLVFALIDCNNFFVSCERLFRPDLAGKPVVVLSSNDGCAVARSNEAKALGIPMAAPAFKYRDLFRQEGVVQFSANFELYGDISRRIVDILATITPRLEVYSVDESFLDLSQLPITNYGLWGRVVRQQILDWTGIPVSIGIAPTKTLAKLASEYAKKHPETGGVLSLSVKGSTSYNTVTDIYDCERLNLSQYLEGIAVEDVWGVGRRLSPKLRAEGIGSAWQLAGLPPKRAQQLIGIHGRQMVAELNGISCYPLELIDKPRKSIARTRTFGEDTNDFNALEAAIASFAARAAFRLRVSGQLARRAGIFLTSNKHKPDYKRWAREIKYEVPTADTGQLISSLTSLLTEVYNPYSSYNRAGVLLYDFVPGSALQIDLLGIVDINKQDGAKFRMAAVDSLNERYGRRTVRFAAEDLGNKWHPRQNLRSPRYTTSWDELPKVRIR